MLADTDADITMMRYHITVEKSVYRNILENIFRIGTYLYFALNKNCQVLLWQIIQLIFYCFIGKMQVQNNNAQNSMFNVDARVKTSTAEGTSHNLQTYTKRTSGIFIKS